MLQFESCLFRCVSDFCIGVSKIRLFLLLFLCFCVSDGIMIIFIFFIFMFRIMWDGFLEILDYIVFELEVFNWI